MVSVHLGPLAFPLNPLLMMAAWVLASFVGERLAGPARAAASRSFLRAALVGLVAARVAFVARAWPAYAASPLSMLDIRDGGWWPAVGLAAALAAGLWSAWRQPVLRRGLGAGTAAGLACWAALSMALGVHDRPALPELELRDLAGAAVPLRAPADGRPMVINLWASWCAPCRAEMPLLAAAQQRERGLRFVFVNHGESAETVRHYLQGQPYALEGVLLDARMALGSAVGTAGLPTTLFVDAAGHVVERHFGPLSAGSLAAQLTSIKPLVQP